MADVHTKAQRSHNMSQVRGQNTKPELKLKKFLKSKGFVHQAELYGRPDFANFKKKQAIFIDGCFWHKCPRCFKFPKTHRNFWKNKITNNVKRDRDVTLHYICSGWRITRIWEHEVNFLKAGGLDSLWKKI
jgi:DNA mismatch endonuclease, patch repair protein